MKALGKKVEGLYEKQEKEREALGEDYSLLGDRKDGLLFDILESWPLDTDDWCLDLNSDTGVLTLSDAEGYAFTLSGDGWLTVRGDGDEQINPELLRLFLELR